MKIGPIELPTLSTVSNWIKPQLAYTEQSEIRKFKRKYFKKSFKVALISVLIFVSFDPLLNAAIDFQLQLKPDGLVTWAWKETPLPINTCWYIFGIDNPNEFLQGAKPFMVEHGPFCYFMYRKRRILEWKDKTVIFMERYEFEFNPEPSKSLNTSIQSVNAPILTGVLLAKNILDGLYMNFLGPAVYNAINMVLTSTGEQLVETFTAGQLMEGRKMRIIEYADAMLRPVRWLGVSVPNFAEGSMGIFNFSFGITKSIPFFELGPYEAYVRTEDGHTVGHIYQFEGRNTYPQFTSPCNRVAGGDGMFFSRPVEAPNLDVFVQHTCRILPFIRSHPHVHAGTKVVRYSMDPSMFNASIPENACYCLNNRPIEDCEGWADMSPCTLGLPIGFSFPHFYNSPLRQQELDGLKPDPSKHVGYLEVEDNLGAPIVAAMTIQAILDVKPVWSVQSLSNLPFVKLPIIWVDVTGGVDGIMSVGLAAVSNFIRFGSYGFLTGGLIYSSWLSWKGYRGPSQRRNSQSSSQSTIVEQLSQAQN